MKKTLFALLFIPLIFLALKLPKNASACVANPSNGVYCDQWDVEFDNNNNGTSWEVHYYQEWKDRSGNYCGGCRTSAKSLVAGPGATGAPGTYSTPHGDPDFKATTYAVHWATACVDPRTFSYRSYGGLSAEGYYRYYWNIGITYKHPGSGDGQGKIGYSGSNNYFGPAYCPPDHTGGGNPPPPPGGGNPPPPPPPSNFQINGYVFIDDNGDGNKDPGEPCYNPSGTDDYDIVMNGGNPKGHSSDCTPSDPIILNSGQKSNTITLLVPQNYFSTKTQYRNEGGSWRIDSNATVTVSGDGDVRWGIKKVKAQISGRAYIDEQPNGKLDSNDTFLDGKGTGFNFRPKATVRMDGNSNSDRKTDGNGRYTFGDLGINSDHDLRIFNPDDCLLDLPDANKTNVNATPNQNDVNFRFLRDKYNIAGTVYFDTDGDGSISAGDTRYKKKATLTVVGKGRSDTSDPDDGTYSIGGNPEGAYDIKLTGLATGFSVVGGNTKSTTVNCAKATVNFLIRGASGLYGIAGSVWVDEDGDGIIDKTPDANGNTVDSKYTKGGTVTIVGTSPLRTDDLSTSGVYSVEGNPNGTYDVRLSGINSQYSVVGANPKLGIVVNNADKTGVNFLLRKNSSNKFSIQGGLYLDTKPLHKRNLTSPEPYIDASGSERIRIIGQGVNAGITPIIINNINPSDDGFTSQDLNPGPYRVYLDNMARAGYSFSSPQIAPPPAFIDVILGASCDDNGGTAIFNCSGGDVTNVDFGISLTNGVGTAWFQAVGGDVRVDSGFKDIIPAGQYVAASSAQLAHGVVFSGGTIDLGGSGDQSAKANSDSWLVTGVKFSPAKAGTSYTSYSYLRAALSKGRVTTTPMFGTGGICNRDNGPDCVLPAALAHGTYITRNNDLTLTDATVFQANSDYIFLIDGDLRIEGNITVPVGSTVLFAVSGSITVDGSITRIDGIFSSDNNFTVETDETAAADSPLVINGTVVVNAILNSNSATSGKFYNKRDLDAGNASAPSIQFVYRPDYVLNAPQVLKYSQYILQEVPPGPNPTPGPTSTPGPTIPPTNAPTNTPTPTPVSTAPGGAGLTGGVTTTNFPGPTAPTRFVSAGTCSTTNGTDDDAVLIRNAIAAATAGTEIDLASCTYHLRTFPITLKTGVSIKGNSKTGTILNAVVGTTYPSKVFYAAPGTTNFNISNFTLTNTTVLPPTVPYTFDAGVTLGTGTWNSNNSTVAPVKNVHVSNLLIKNYRRWAIDISDSQNIEVDGSTFQDATELGGLGRGYGILLEMDQSYNNWIHNNQAIGPKIRHAYLTQYRAHNNLYENNTATLTSNDSFDMHGEDEYENEFRNNTISGCSLTDFYTGVTVYPSAFGVGEVPTSTSLPPPDPGAHDFTGDYNWIHNNTATGCYSGARLSNVDYTYIEGNSFQSMRSGGIIVGDLDSYTFPPPAPTPVQPYGTTHTVIRNNTIKLSPTGIYLRLADFTTLTGNLVTNNTSTGLRITTETNKYTITNNDFRSNPTPYNLNGNLDGTFSNNLP